MTTGACEDAKYLLLLLLAARYPRLGFDSIGNIMCTEKCVILTDIGALRGPRLFAYVSQTAVRV